MHLHEYQAKRLFPAYGLLVPAAEVVDAVGAVAAAAGSLDRSVWIVKAQVHAGGHGKSGGVKRVDDVGGPGQVVDEMPGSRLLTKQTDPGGVEPVLSA